MSGVSVREIDAGEDDFALFYYVIPELEIRDYGNL